MVARYETASEPDAALAAAGRMLAARRFRLRTGNGWVSAEKGYLREVGNLLFHIALLALLGSVALGGIWGYKANRLLVAGQSFANTPTALDVFRPGRLVTPSNLQPFTITLKSFRASYVTSGPERSQPITFDASLQYAAAAGAPERSYLLRVNHPLRVDGVRVYLIGHGYAPIFKITSATGKVEFNDPVPFIPVEQSGLTSEGVIKVPFASPSQLGFAGVFLPSAADLGGRLESVFPAPLNPEVSLVSYAGNLGMGSGPPQSVYQLVTSQMHKLPIAPRPLAVGQSMKLPDGAGTLTFTGYRQWISLAITYDPGQTAALISGILALAGLILSFMVRRRRIFVRAYRGPDGGTIVDVGGLARSDAAGGFEGEFAHLAEQFRAGDGGRPLAADPGKLTSRRLTSRRLTSPADIAPADIAQADIAPADTAPADAAPADAAPADAALTPRRSRTARCRRTQRRPRIARLNRSVAIPIHPSAAPRGSEVPCTSIPDWPTPVTRSCSRPSSCMRSPCSAMPATSRSARSGWSRTFRLKCRSSSAPERRQAAAMAPARLPFRRLRSRWMAGSPRRDSGRPASGCARHSD